MEVGMRDIQNILSEGLIGRRTSVIPSIGETLSRCIEGILSGSPSESLEASHEMVQVLDGMDVEKIAPGREIDLWDATKNEDIILALYEDVPGRVRLADVKKLYISWMYEGLDLVADLNKSASRRFSSAFSPGLFEPVGLRRPQGHRSPLDPGSIAFMKSYFIFQDKEKGHNRIYNIRKDSPVRKMIESFAWSINEKIEK